MALEPKTCKNCQREFTKETDFLRETAQWRLCSAENLWFNCTCGSTLMLPKGKFPWYSPTLNMSNEASSLFNKIAVKKQLPHIPTAIMQIQQLLSDPQVEARALSSAVKKDPILAAEIIKTADGLKALRSADNLPIKSLEHAITYIGHGVLKDLVIAASLKSFKLETAIFDADAYWDHAFLTAGIAEKLAERFKFPQLMDKIYVAGCLCNIGKIVGALFFPKQIDDTFSYINNLKTLTTWEDGERKTNTDSHCVLGEIGAAFWGLPPFVLDSARHHHKPMQKTLPGESDEIVNITAFANQLAHWIRQEPHRIDNALLQGYAKMFELDQKQLDSLASELSKLKKN